MTFIKQLAYQWSDDEEKMKYVESQRLFEQRNKSFIVSNIKSTSVETSSKDSKNQMIIIIY